MFFKERRLAFRNSVAGNGGQPELLLRDSLLLERLLDGLCKAAAAGEYPAETRGISQLCLIHGRYIYPLCGEHRLHLLEGYCIIHILLGLGILHLALFRYAGAYEHHMAALVLFLQPTGYLRHWGEIVGNIFRKLREALLYIVYESRAAGGGKKALFRKLFRLKPRHHVGAPCRLHHIIKAESLYARHHLLRRNVRVLARHGGCNHRIHAIVFIVAGVAYKGYYLGNAGLIRYRAEGALIHAGAAGYALVLVYYRLFGLLVYIYSLCFACADAGAHMLHYGGIWAYRHTFAALHAL